MRNINRGSGLGSKSQLIHTLSRLALIEVVESLECVANERQAHLRGLDTRRSSCRSSSLLQMGCVVRLVDLVSGEVGGVNVGGKLGFKRCSNPTQAIEVNATEKLVRLDLVGTSSPKTILGVAYETGKISYLTICRIGAGNLPSNQILRLGAQLDVLGKVERLSPVHDLPVGIVCVLSTERWPSNLTFKHDRTQTPPIAVLGVSMTAENFRRNVIRGTNRRVSHHSPRLSPIVDDTSVTDS